jgi:hypothetical protein
MPLPFGYLYIQTESHVPKFATPNRPAARSYCLPSNREPDCRKPSQGPTSSLRMRPPSSRARFARGITSTMRRATDNR